MSHSRILVVDDDRGARLLARKALGRAGFIVEEAEDGVQALAVFQECWPRTYFNGCGNAKPGWLWRLSNSCALLELMSRFLWPPAWMISPPSIERMRWGLRILLPNPLTGLF